MKILALVLLTVVIGSAWAEESIKATQFNCLHTRFKRAHHPSLEELKPGSAWECTGFRVEKSENGQMSLRSLEKIWQYRFTVKRYSNDHGQAWTEIENDFYMGGPYMPLVMDGRRRLNGLYAPIQGMGVTWWDNVLRVDDQGRLLSEWSIGLASAQMRSVEWAHVDAPVSVTAQRRERLVNQMLVCTLADENVSINELPCF